MRPILLSLMCSAWLCAVGPAVSQDPPFRVSFDQAPGGASAAWVVPSGGWPLSLSITVEDSRLAGVGGFGDDWGRPTRDWQVLLVTEDPDGCPSWIPPRFRSPARVSAGCTRPVDRPWPRDETWLELWPDRPAGETGCEDRPKAAAYELFDDDSGGANTKVLPLGPPVGGRQCYGRHRDLPQLVVLADAGPGIVSDLAFRQVVPRRQRNLAGFFQSITFTWRDREQRRSVGAHMTAPRWLFSSTVAIDTSVSRVFGDVASVGLQCSQLLSFDGAPPVCQELLFDVQLPTIIRAFLVAGEAPDVLVDRNGDGVVDAADAGQALLSNEAVLRVSEHFGRYYFDVDLDGDGRAATYPLPGSPVDLTDPPP